MNQITRIGLHLLAAILALMMTLGVLLLIAYHFDLFVPPDPDTNQVLAITGVALVDLEGASIVPDLTLLIENGRLRAIEPGRIVPPDAREIAANGLYALPLLTDSAGFLEAPTAQQHTLLSGEWAWEITRSLPDHRQALIQAGVGESVDLGGGLETILRSRDLLARGELAGPRLDASGPMLTTPGGWPGETLFPHLLAEVTQPLTTTATAENTVRTWWNHGVDLISVSYTSLGGRYPQLSLDVLEAVIDTAHELELPVLVTTTSLEEATEAVAAGADALVGGVTLAEQSIPMDLLARMRDQGTVYIPTLAAVELRQFSGPESLASAQANALSVYQAGIPLLPGSGLAPYDTQPGASLHRDLALLVTAGVAQVDALRAATNAAATLFDEREPSQLEAEAPADLMLVAGNPLEGIHALAHPRLVVRDGKVLVDQITAP